MRHTGESHAVVGQAVKVQRHTSNGCGGLPPRQKLLFRKIFLRQKQPCLRPTAAGLRRQMRRIVIRMTVRIHNGIRRLKGGFGPQPPEQMTVQRGESRHTRIVERVYPDADAAQLHGNACVCTQRNTDRHSARRQFFVWMARFSAFSAASRMVSVTVG